MSRIKGSSANFKNGSNRKALKAVYPSGDCFQPLGKLSRNHFLYFRSCLSVCIHASPEGIGNMEIDDPSPEGVGHGMTNGKFRKIDHEVKSAGVDLIEPLRVKPFARDVHFLQSLESGLGNFAQGGQSCRGNFE